MFSACTCHQLLHVFLFFCLHFFSVSICVLCFFVWAASYDGLMPPLEIAIVTIHMHYLCYVYLANKLSLSPFSVDLTSLTRLQQFSGDDPGGRGGRLPPNKNIPEREYLFAPSKF